MDIKMTVDKIKFAWKDSSGVNDYVYLDLTANGNDDGTVGIAVDSDCDPETWFPREVLIKMAEYIKRLDTDVVVDS